jgi:hypothetical protein
MKAKLLLAISLVSALILLSACQTNYICEDGRIVSDIRDCEETIIITEPDTVINITGQAEPEKQLTKYEGEYYPVGEEKTARGITLNFRGYYYVKKSDDFGKITAIIYTISNNALYDITPYLKLGMVNAAGDRDLRVAEVDMEYRILSPGQSMTGESAAGLSFNKLDAAKVINLDIYDSPSGGTNLFSIEKEITFE